MLKPKVLKIFIYGAINFVLVIILDYYIESVSNGELLLFPNWINPKKVAVLLNKEHSWWITGLIGVLTVISYGVSHYSTNNHFRKTLWNNMCEQIFRNNIKENNSIKNNDYRVSIFKYGYHIEWYFIFPWITRGLKMVGRHQTIQSSKRCKVIFKESEGCVGQAYKTNMVVNMKVNKFNENNQDQYFRECEKKFNMPIRKSKKLNVKANNFVCIPIKYYNKDSVYAVISIDSVNATRFSLEVIESIEQFSENINSFIYE